MTRLIRITSLILILSLFSSYNPSYVNVKKSYIFPIKNIEIVNNDLYDSHKLIIGFNNIKNTSLLFFNPKNIKLLISKFEFIESFRIKKIYPDTIRIIITEKKLLAIYMNGKKKFFVTNQGDVVKYAKLQGYENLPLVFGKNINFKNFFNEINKKDVFFNKIEKFLYFEIGRWDIILKDGKTIKLPNKNYSEILDNFILMSKEKNFDKYNVFDFRIKAQLILK